MNSFLSFLDGELSLSEPFFAFGVLVNDVLIAWFRNDLSYWGLFSFDLYSLGALSNVSVELLVKGFQVLDLVLL